MAADLRTGRNSLKCSICKKCFDFNSALTDHVKIHSDQRPFKCTQCDKIFKQRFTRTPQSTQWWKALQMYSVWKCFWKSSHLQVHLWIHSGERPYKCTQCDKCFRRSLGLKRHFLIHTNARPFKCTQCEKCFRYSHSLQGHMRQHSGENPTNVLDVKNVLVRHLTCNVICWYTVEKNPTNVLSVTSVSDSHHLWKRWLVKTY